MQYNKKQYTQYIYNKRHERVKNEIQEEKKRKKKKKQIQEK